MRIRIYVEPYTHHILILHIELYKSDLPNYEQSYENDENDV